MAQQNRLSLPQESPESYRIPDLMSPGASLAPFVLGFCPGSESPRVGGVGASFSGVSGNHLVTSADNCPKVEPCRPAASCSPTPGAHASPNTSCLCIERCRRQMCSLRRKVTHVPPRASRPPRAGGSPAASRGLRVLSRAGAEMAPECDLKHVGL